MHICEREFLCTWILDNNLISYFSLQIPLTVCLVGFNVQIESVCNLIVTFSMHILIFAWIASTGLHQLQLSLKRWSSPQKLICQTLNIHID